MSQLPDPILVAINDYWSETFLNIHQAFLELGGSSLGPQWVTMAMVCALWEQDPEAMAHMWSLLKAQPSFLAPRESGTFPIHTLKEILNGVSGGDTRGLDQPSGLHPDHDAGDLPSDDPQ